MTNHYTIWQNRQELFINCVGPFVLYGEKVIDACLKAGTHHVDVSGEPNYMELMQLHKHKLAQEKGVYIVSACGLDSIPCDLGIIFLDQHFEGVINSVVTYLEFSNGGTKGAIFNIGTWDSLVNSIPIYREHQQITRKLFPKELPALRPKLKKRIFPHKTNLINGWILPFPGSDASVVNRTQRYFHEVENKRPIQIDTLCVFKSFWYVFLCCIMALPVLFLSLCKCGRNLLVRYPEKFSFGYFSKNPPSQEVMESSSFKMTLVAKGWSGKLPNENGQFSISCNKEMVAVVKGKNPVYGSTCITLVGAAITILNEKDKLAGNGKGGVYPPGAAFAKTNYVKLLNDNQVTFDIVS